MWRRTLQALAHLGTITLSRRARTWKRRSGSPTSRWYHHALRRKWQFFGDGVLRINLHTNTSNRIVNGIVNHVRTVFCFNGPNSNHLATSGGNRDFYQGIAPVGKRRHARAARDFHSRNLFWMDANWQFHGHSRELFFGLLGCLGTIQTAHWLSLTWEVSFWDNYTHLGEHNSLASPPRHWWCNDETQVPTFCIHW